MNNIYTADRETGNKIDSFRSFDAALEAIKGYEEEDRKNGEFTENFYDIVDEECRSLKRIYRLLKGEANLTKAEFRKFNRGDMIYGDGRVPEEINRFENLKDAKEVLAGLMCEYKVSYYDENCYITEYAIEEVIVNNDGEIEEYGDCWFASASFRD